ncbi:MAG: sugar ABC transporter ATP-binding protein [Planctomycetota bacterium]|jgi:ribose transport system ATP-binding protein|nr:sugar ABC transporter ATP-binding protein [Planctomycetota bacterium]
MNDFMPDNVVEFENVGKVFGTSPALQEIHLTLAPGECLGLVGHNGAGKSTLMNILAGIFPPTSGKFALDGVFQGVGYDVRVANARGVWAVFQELSLCLNLTVAENLRVFHPEFRGWGWRKRAGDAIAAIMDEIFPGHGIKPGRLVESLTLGQRQTVEIAKAFAAGDGLRLLILDEPTSALDYHTARQLLDYLNRSKGGRFAIIYISHMLDEVLACADRIVVMKDGRISGEVRSAEATRDQLIELMGSKAAPIRGEGRTRRIRDLSARPLLISPKSAGTGRGPGLSLREGEVVGLAGLSGHGQTNLLVDLFDYRHNSDYHARGPFTFIPGDRQRDGNFPLWSIVNNLTIQVYPRVRRYRLIDLSLERSVSGRWRDSIGIRAGSLNDNILSLSGGNQQKVLFARCLESDAKAILMDDPTRGVDVGTKEIIYRLIREESDRGRAFVWYTTEMDELRHCDRVYVFRNGAIVAEMPGDEATEEAILRSSF